MKVKILAVESGKEDDSPDVLLSIGEEKKSFRFIREFDIICGHQIQMIKHEDKFWKTFKFNQHIVFKVTELVLGKYRIKRFIPNNERKSTVLSCCWRRLRLG